MENYFDKNFPDDNSVTRKVRIGVEAFNRIKADSPMIYTNTASDMAQKIAKIEFGTTEWHNFIGQILRIL